MTTAYVLVANVPGYVPETDPIQFDSREEALAARRDEIIYGADHLADTYGEFHDILIPWLEAADNTDDDTIYLPMSDSPHDLGICFEIVAVH
jgi:hypothetical protein